MLYLAHGEKLSAAQVNTILQGEYRRMNGGEPPSGLDLRRYFIERDPSGSLVDTVTALVAARS